MIRVVGIDPSLSCTGIALVGDGEKDRNDTIFLAMSMRSKAGNPPRSVRNRMHRMRSLAAKTFEGVAAMKADYIFVEGYSFGSKGNSLTLLAEYGGILRSLLGRLAPVIEVPPATIKKFATGSGRADKSLMLSKALEIYPVKNSDEADALHLAILGHCAAARRVLGDNEPIGPVQIVRSAMEKEGLTLPWE